MAPLIPKHAPDLQPITADELREGLEVPIAEAAPISARAPALLAAYRYHRSISHDGRPWPTCSARTAFRCAQRDVDLGIERVPPVMPPVASSDAAADEPRTQLKALIAFPALAMVPQRVQPWQANAGAATRPAHTPGPWHRNIKPASKYPVVWSGRNTHVAAIVPGAPRRSGSDAGMSEEEQEANINLIVAAPDLLFALKSLVEDVGDYLAWERPCLALDTAQAAIARAEGRQS